MGFKEACPEKVAEVESILHKYKGKEAEVFTSLAKKYDKPNALNVIFESRVKKIDKNDYFALTSLFLEVFNPSRAGQAEKLLSRYKGKEAEMFAEYSSKWKTINPLEQPAAASPQTKPQNPFAPRLDKLSTNNVPAPTPAPSPFATEVKSSAPSDSFGKSSPAPSPFATQVKSSATEVKSSTPSDSLDKGSNTIEYHTLLTKFYEKHNAQKVPEVANNLEKYKGREPEMFAKLAQKYKTSNPLLDAKANPPSSANTSFGFGNITASLGAGLDSKSPFGSTAPVSSGPSISSATPPPTSNTSMFSGGEKTAAFGTASSVSATTNSPFKSTPGFGTGGSNPSPFGATSSSSAFGAQSPTTSTPFSGTAFGSTPAASQSSFGAPATSALTAGSNASSSKFGGRNPRDMLVSFYQTKDPSKLNSVDNILTKYAGKEEQLFLNLARKYNLDPSMFGVGTPQPTTATSFGSVGTLGMGNNTGFAGGNSPFGGGGSSGAFGAPGGFATAAKVGGFGSLASSSTAGGGFGGFGGGTSAAPSFGSQTSPFGSARR